MQLTLLAKCYVQCGTSLSDGVTRFNPTGYVELQGSLAQRVVSEI